MTTIRHAILFCIMTAIAVPAALVIIGVACDVIALDHLQPVKAVPVTYLARK